MVNLTPSSNFQTVIDNNPTETLFVVQGGLGTYFQKEIPTPRAGITIQFEGGVVLDGRNSGGTSPKAYFCRPSTRKDGVQFIGLQSSPAELKFYAPSSSEGVIDAHGSGCENWLLQDLFIHHAAITSGISTGDGGMGTKIGNNGVCRRVECNDCDQYGFGGGTSGTPGSSKTALWENCHSRRNGLPGGHSGNTGGTKFVGNNLTVRATFANASIWEDNNGPGVWFDTGNNNFLCEGITTRNNFNQGCYIEVGQKDFLDPDNMNLYVGGTFRKVLSVNNGLEGRLLWYDAAITAGHSANVEMDRCVSYNNKKGFGGHQQHRHEPCGSAANPGHGICPLSELKNLFVHECKTYVLAGGQWAAGVTVPAWWIPDPIEYNAYAGAANNRFEDNEYFILNTISDPFAWDTSGSATHNAISWSQWQAQGQDVNGTRTTFTSGNVPSEPEHPMSAISGDRTIKVKMIL